MPAYIDRLQAITGVTEVGFSRSERLEKKAAGEKPASGPARPNSGAGASSGDCRNGDEQRRSSRSWRTSRPTRRSRPRPRRAAGGAGDQPAAPNTGAATTTPAAARAHPDRIHGDRRFEMTPQARSLGATIAIGVALLAALWFLAIAPKRSEKAAGHDERRRSAGTARRGEGPGRDVHRVTQPVRRADDRAARPRQGRAVSRRHLGDAARAAAPREGARQRAAPRRAEGRRGRRTQRRPPAPRLPARSPGRAGWLRCRSRSSTRASTSTSSTSSRPFAARCA